MSGDSIIIRGLEVPTRIGVPDVERATWQVIHAEVRLVLRRGFDTMKDDIAETIDYVSVADRVKTIAAKRPRKLLEKLASEIVTDLLKTDGVAEVDFELRKHILPGTDHVAVRMIRSRE